MSILEHKLSARLPTPGQKPLLFLSIFITHLSLKSQGFLTAHANKGSTVTDHSRDWEGCSLYMPERCTVFSTSQHWLLHPHCPNVRGGIQWEGNSILGDKGNYKSLSCYQSKTQDNNQFWCIQKFPQEKQQRLTTPVCHLPPPTKKNK